ncbi:MAG: hypothetical protein HYX44_02920 [Aquabacterium sp.]|nr:hypothetical protein [Aquabacterium sp.]
MHTPFRPFCPAHPTFHLAQRAVWRGLASASLVAVSLLSACGGGGGGGGGSEAAGSVNAGSAATSPWPFPFGMSVGSPAALANSTAVVSGAMGVDNLGLRTTMTPQQAVVSSQADAVATGRLSLAGSGLVNVAALFDTSARSHAACYGHNHDNASGANGTLPLGEVAIWRDTDPGTGQACAAAELAAQTQGVTAQAHQATLLMAALRQAVAANTSVLLPTAGGSVDLSSQASALLTPLLAGATVPAPRRWRSPCCTRRPTPTPITRACCAWPCLT